MNIVLQFNDYANNHPEILESQEFQELQNITEQMFNGEISEGEYNERWDTIAAKILQNET
jgi:hypothetical protein